MPSECRHWILRRAVPPDIGDPKVDKQGCPKCLWFSSGQNPNPDAGETRTHMLRPKGNQVVYRGRVVPLNVCTEELSSLRKSNRVETVLEFCDICNLFSDKVDLVVHVSVLRCVGKKIARVRKTAYNVRSRPCDPSLGPHQRTPSG